MCPEDIWPEAETASPPLSLTVMARCQDAAGKFVATGTNVKGMLTTFQCQIALLETCASLQPI